MSQQGQLLRLVGRDVSRHLWLMLLGLTVLASAVSVVVVAHQNRRAVSQLDQLQQQHDALDVEWRNLILEENALAEHARVERLAREKLHMHRPDPGAERRVD